MINLILLLLCLCLGVFFQRVRDFPSDAHRSLNAFVLYISLPALSLLYLPQIPLSVAVLYPLGVAWIVFLGGFLFFRVLGKVLGFSPATVGALVLVAGLGNTSFVGLPLLEALYGPAALRTGLLIDQGGTYLVLGTLGVIVATAAASGSLRFAPIARRVISFPPFVALLIGLGMNVAGWQHPPAMAEILQKLGATLTPLALVSVGLQLQLRPVEARTTELVVGLGYKLLLAPALVYLLYVVLLGEKGLVVEVCVVEAAMAPMIAGAILAGQYGLRPALVNLLVGVGIPLSLLTVLGWYWLLL